MMMAPINEIFCSVQGEGPYVGVRQAFVRFEGCNLSCKYCDTPEAKRAGQKCMVEVTPGKRDFTQLNNPVDNEKIVEVVEKYGKIHSVSLTGGEPLLHANFIRDLKVNAPLYLETNMTLPEKAALVKDRVRYVAGDFKLSDAFEDSFVYDDIREATIRSYKVLRGTKDRDCFCKVVIQKDSKMDEVLYNVEQINEYISTVVLQPLTPFSNAQNKTSITEVLKMQERLADIVEEVNVIPQTHKIWGAL